MEMQHRIDELTRENIELKKWKQKYNSNLQSLCRLSTRLRKLCKRLTPTDETVVAMQKLSDDIRDQVKNFQSVC